jgi:ribosomal protein L3 glutamine methyltransferase
VKRLETIRDFVRWGASGFQAAGLYYGHGTSNALDEALVLVRHALYLDHFLPEAYFDCRITDAERNAVNELFQRRINERLPAAYLTGQAWFAGLPFLVSEDVLVPRSPIAEILERGFEPWLEADRIERVLDLCTGSGCIALAAAHYLPHAEVDGVELSPAALAVAQRNGQELGLEEQVEFYLSDLFDALPAGSRYDVIVSNPPYVSPEEYASLPEEYRHEPVMGLKAEDEGLEIVQRILRQAADFLHPGGILIVEVGNSAEALEQRYPEVPFLWLEFERGGDGVFLLTEEQLQSCEF